MTDLADRLGFVLTGTSFPAHRWELIARAECDGADASPRRELHQLEQRGYAAGTEITDTINCFQPTPIQRLGSGGASQRRDLR